MFSWDGVFLCRSDKSQIHSYIASTFLHAGIIVINLHTQKCCMLLRIEPPTLYILHKCSTIHSTTYRSSDVLACIYMACFKDLQGYFLYEEVHHSNMVMSSILKALLNKSHSAQMTWTDPSLSLVECDACLWHV